MRRKMVAVLLSALAVTGVPQAAAGLANIGQSQYAGNVATLKLVYTMYSGSCYGGRNGYHMDAAKVKFERADNQFTARGNVGQMVASGLQCDGTGNHPLNKYLNLPNAFANNTYYTTNAPAGDIFISWSANPANQFGAYAKLDVYRSSSKVSTLCVKSYLWSAAGNPCA